MIYAQIQNEIVTNVIVADENFILSLPNVNDYKLLTRGGIGWTYNKTSDVFIAPKPFESWLLDASHNWRAPIEYPSDAKVYLWNEDSLNWILQN